MPYNPKLLALAREKLIEIRKENVNEHIRRVRQVYQRIPEIKQIDESLRTQLVELARIAFSHAEDQQQKITVLKEENLSLQMKRAELLVQNGYPITWLDEIVTCPICRDSGNTDTGICQCLEKLYNKELTLSLSTLLHTGDESFEKLDLSLYSDEYSDYFQCVPREYMRKVFQFCREYAEKFPAVKEDLLFQGEPGLGKTYLSACIAREIAGRGFSVLYDTAVSAFASFEDKQFSRSPEQSEAGAEKVRRMLDCDLLILDDLGTEVVTPVVTSALYTLVNTRLNIKKRTIISTTLYADELASRYTPSIASRLDGYFKTIHFAGSDIRAILRSRKL